MLSSGSLRERKQRRDPYPPTQGGSDNRPPPERQPAWVDEDDEELKCARSPRLPLHYPSRFLWSHAWLVSLSLQCGHRRPAEAAKAPADRGRECGVWIRLLPAAAHTVSGGRDDGPPLTIMLLFTSHHHTITSSHPHTHTVTGLRGSVGRPRGLPWRDGVQRTRKEINY